LGCQVLAGEKISKGDQRIIFENFSQILKGCHLYKKNDIPIL